MNGMREKLKIVVMLGGPGAERAVSLRSGAGVARALRSLGHTVIELDPQTPEWVLPPQALPRPAPSHPRPRHPMP